MAVWTCADCTARYAVGAPRCPQCGCKVRVEDGSEDDDMAKITVHGGPSDEHAQDRGEDVSAGTSSSTSSAKDENSPASTTSSSGAHRSPARTTASRSKRARTGSSSAAGTDGGPEAGTSATDSADA